MKGVGWDKIARGVVAAAGLATALCLTPACAPPPASEGGFDAEDPASKLYAIRAAGTQSDQTKIPELIEQLNSDDPAVRMYAILALEKITGDRKAYDPYAPAHERNAAVRRWVDAYNAKQIQAVDTENADNQS